MGVSKAEPRPCQLHVDAADTGTQASCDQDQAQEPDPVKQVTDLQEPQTCLQSPTALGLPIRDQQSWRSHSMPKTSEHSRPV